MEEYIYFKTLLMYIVSEFLPNEYLHGTVSISGEFP